MHNALAPLSALGLLGSTTTIIPAGRQAGAISGVALAGGGAGINPSATGGPAGVNPSLTGGGLGVNPSAVGR